MSKGENKSIHENKTENLSEMVDSAVCTSMIYTETIEWQIQTTIQLRYFIYKYISKSCVYFCIKIFFFTKHIIYNKLYTNTCVTPYCVIVNKGKSTQPTERSLLTLPMQQNQMQNHSEI